MHKARPIELEGLDLAAAAVGDQECASAQKLNEGEEAEPRRPDEALGVELGEAREALDRGDRDGVVDRGKSS